MRTERGILDGEVALVTGSASAMGYAIAKLFAEEGARAVAVDINGTDLAKWNGVKNVVPVLADVTGAEDIDCMYSEAEHRFGRVEIPANVKKTAGQKMLKREPAQRIKGFDEGTAKAEAERCLNCAGPLCRDICPFGAPQFGSEENDKRQKRNFCIDRWVDNKPPICVAACPLCALDARPVEDMQAKYATVKKTAGFVRSAVTSPANILHTREEVTQPPTVPVREARKQDIISSIMNTLFEKEHEHLWRLLEKLKDSAMASARELKEGD